MRVLFNPRGRFFLGISGRPHHYLKHGGQTTLENLAWSCFPCNNHKGSDVGSVVYPEKQFVRLFNPREDKWEDHFYFQEGVIHAKSSVGEATINVLKLNAPERIMERREFI